MNRPALRLQAARAATWVLLVGAWLVLGALGRRHLPLWAGGMLPLVLWLACMAALDHHLGRSPPSPQALQRMLLLSALACGLGLAASQWGGGAAAVLAAAGAWAMLLVAAMRTVRGWAGPARQPGTGSGPPSPLAVARWAMLPMMATLVTMSDWCAGAGLGRNGAAGLLALHLLMMLAPAAALAILRRLGLRLPAQALCAALLVAGGLALCARPELQGLMLASLLHSAAWSVAWSEGGGQTTSQRAMAWTPAVIAPLALLCLGTALTLVGPAALMAVHAALALAAAGLSWPLRASRRWRPAL